MFLCISAHRLCVHTRWRNVYEVLVVSRITSLSPAYFVIAHTHWKLNQKCNKLFISFIELDSYNNRSPCLHLYLQVHWSWVKQNRQQSKKEDKAGKDLVAQECTQEECSGAKHWLESQPAYHRQRSRIALSGEITSYAFHVNNAVPPSNTEPTTFFS